jgi:hypothetical protein
LKLTKPPSSTQIFNWNHGTVQATTSHAIRLGVTNDSGDPYVYTCTAVRHTTNEPEDVAGDWVKLYQDEAGTMGATPYPTGSPMDLPVVAFGETTYFWVEVSPPVDATTVYHEYEVLITTALDPNGYHEGRLTVSAPPAGEEPIDLNHPVSFKVPLQHAHPVEFSVPLELLHRLDLIVVDNLTVRYHRVFLTVPEPVLIRIPTAFAVPEA